MKKNVRKLFCLALFAFALSVFSQSQLFAQTFKPADESFLQYKYPDWFRDAKFGIWAHWGPQAVPRQGDWYAKNMYIQEGEKWETGAYEDHLKKYGHPSIAGYKAVSYTH